MQPRLTVRSESIEPGRHFLQETPLISHYSLSFIAGDSDGRLSDAVHGARRQGVLQAGDGRRAGRVDGYQVQGEGRGAQRGDFVSGKREGGTVPSAGYASNKLVRN